MKYRVLGCSGGEAPGYRLSSFLLDDRLLIDTGAAPAALRIRRQAAIDHILLTHSHLDHTGGLPLLADNVVGLRSTPIQVYGIAPTLEAVRRHLLNDVLWPDFSRIPSSASPTVVYRDIQENGPFEVAGFRITASRVNHVVECVAFLIQGRQESLLHLGDTGPTEAVWRLVREVPRLRAVCIETTFPNRLQQIADRSGHLTPQSLEKELRKLDRDVPIYVYHRKPNFEREILAELKQLRLRSLRILRDGVTYRF
jgi:ribonuclease BN (tRNA processing enzyme)